MNRMVGRYRLFRKNYTIGPVGMKCIELITTNKIEISNEVPKTILTSKTGANKLYLNRIQDNIKTKIEAYINVLKIIDLITYALSSAFDSAWVRLRTSTNSGLTLTIL